MLLDGFTYTTPSDSAEENPITLDNLVAAFDKLETQKPPDWIGGLIISKLVKPGEYWRKQDPNGVPYGMLHPVDWIRQSWELHQVESKGLLGTTLGIPIYESDEMAARLIAGLPLREIAGFPVIFDDSLKPNNWYIRPLIF